MASNEAAILNLQNDRCSVTITLRLRIRIPLPRKSPVTAIQKYIGNGDENAFSSQVFGHKPTYWTS